VTPRIDVSATEIPDVLIIRTREFRDARGAFSECYSARDLAEHGVDLHFVQDNQSVSASRGTIRGLHFQAPPFAQAKLIRVVRGAILDVAVDLRKGSPSFGRHVSRVLTAANLEQFLVPEGFAHGFSTLEDETTVLYKATDYYSPDHDRGLRWDDPALGIDWGVDPAAAVLSDRDRRHPRLAELPPCFEYPGAGNPEKDVGA
jgi:dTDP-4-dehydrorhamnose 3,5-epimerase